MVENHTEVTSECWRQTLISFHFLNPSSYFFCILKHNAIAGQVDEEIVSNNPFFERKIAKSFLRITGTYFTMLISNPS